MTAKASGGYPPGAQTGADWLAWIETSADLYDPLIGDPRDIFKSVAEVTSWTYRDS